MAPTRRAPTPEQVDRAFGRVLRDLREEAGISQERLGHEADSGRTFISELERGEKGASVKMLYRLSIPLETLPSEMLRRVEVELGKGDRRSR